MKHKWNKVGIGHEIYVSSSMDYDIHVWLIGDGGKRLQLDYDGGYWLYRDSRDFREFVPPAYVVAMFVEAFTKAYNAGKFTFYEYRKIGGDLVKDADPSSLRYHDAEHWRHVAEAIIGEVKR